MSLDKIDKIRKVKDQLGQLNVQRPDGLDTAVMRQRFDALMREEVNKPVETTEVSRDLNKAASPMDEARKLGGQSLPADRASAENLAVQMRDTSTRMETVKQKMVGGQIDLKPSVASMMRKKLHHIDENIKAALTKAGATEADLKASKGEEQPMVDGVLNPIHRFIGLLTNGQHDLEKMEKMVLALGSKDDVSPGMMLAIQIKMGRVQQEIELFTSLLNKALESTKTIMNVQV